MSLLLAWADPSTAQVPEAGTESPLHDTAEVSLHDLGRQTYNPVSPLWQLTFESQIAGVSGGGLDGRAPFFSGSFVPTGPLWQGRPGKTRLQWAEDFGIYAQLTLPFIETVPVPGGSGGDGRVSGFGDIQLGGIIGPNRAAGLIWGIGPTLIFPSASDDALGQGKWQAGPALVAGHLGEEWISYVIAQQWWSFAGDDSRPETSQLSLNYVLVHAFAKRWQIGMQPTMTVDWTASEGNAVSFPVGLGIGRTVRIGKLAVQLWLEADYYAVRPDDVTTPRWGIDLQISPVIADPFR